MTIKVEQGKGNYRAIISIELADDRIKTGLRNGLREIGKELKRSARASFRERKTGRIYSIRGKKHRASAPGESPAILSGNLDRNVGYRTRGHLELEFGDKSQQGQAPYGKFLEFGTKNQDGSERIAPRLHIKRAVLAKSKDNYNTLLRYTKKEITK